MAEIISTEARAFANEGRAGLSYFAPNINIYRSDESALFLIAMRICISKQRPSLGEGPGDTRRR